MVKTELFGWCFEQNEGTKIIKPQVVKKAVKQAIKEWSESESNGQA